MAHRRHSAAFDVLSSVLASVKAATYPPHPATGRAPLVDDDTTVTLETADEAIIVNLAAEEGSQVAWTRTSPGGRDEQVPVEVHIVSQVPGRTRTQVLERLEVLADVVQGIYVDTSAHTFTPPSVAVQLGGLSGVSVQVWGTDSGRAGSAVLRFEFTCRL